MYFPSLSRQDWPHDPQGLDGFYGNPRGITGSNPAWEAENLVTFTFPWKIKSGGQTGRIHKKVKPSLDRVLAAIWDHVGHDQSKIDASHLSEFGGSYVFRVNRNNPSVLSNHARGIAIDLAPDENPNRQAWHEDSTHLPRFVIEAFKQEGWRWGGDFSSTKDAMHFEAVFDQHHDQPPVPAPKFDGNAPLPMPIRVPIAPASTTPVIPPILALGEEAAAMVVRQLLSSNPVVFQEAALLRAKLVVARDVADAAIGLIDKVAPITGQAPPTAAPFVLPGLPIPPATAPTVTHVLRGDGSFSFTAEVVGQDIVVRNVVATWFGGPNDKSDNGETASGVSTLANPNILGVSLPMDGFAHSPLTQGSPLPKIPWHTPVRVKNLANGIEQTFPLIELGPSKRAQSHAAIDFTEAAFPAVGGDTNVGVLHVDYTIPGAARFLPAAMQGELRMSMQSDGTVNVPVGSPMASKINWTAAVQIIATLLTLTTGGKLNLTSEQQVAIIGFVSTIAPLAVMIFRTFGTTTITPQSLPK